LPWQAEAGGRRRISYSQIDALPHPQMAATEDRRPSGRRPTAPRPPL